MGARGPSMPAASVLSLRGSCQLRAGPRGGAGSVGGTMSPTGPRRLEFRGPVAQLRGQGAKEAQRWVSPDRDLCQSSVTWKMGISTENKINFSERQAEPILSTNF